MNKTMLCLLVVVFFATPSMAANKVVVIPLNTSQSNTDKLLGKGRPGTDLITHIAPDGYCINPSGTKFALSQIAVDWGNAEDACPQGTWVCTTNELPRSSNCDIVPFATFYGYACDGTKIGLDFSTKTRLNGWVSDMVTLSHFRGIVKDSDDFAIDWDERICEHYRVWCCWK